MDFLWGIFCQKLCRNAFQLFIQMYLLIYFLQPGAASSFALQKSVRVFELQIASRPCVCAVSGQQSVKNTPGLHEQNQLQSLRNGSGCFLWFFPQFTPWFQNTAMTTTILKPWSPLEPENWNSVQTAGQGSLCIHLLIAFRGSLRQVDGLPRKKVPGFCGPGMCRHSSLTVF